MPFARYFCIFINVGLGEAAKRDVGTGENQIPDMVSFSGVRDFYGKQLLPGGLILQWLTIPSSAAVKAVTLDNGNYQLSGYKWPQSFGVLFAVFATKVSGSTSRARLESGTAVLDDICRFAIIVDCQRTAFIDLCFYCLSVS